MRLLIPLLLLTMQSFAQAPVKTTIEPFFDRIDDGPTFYLECQNTNASSVSSGASEWPGLGTGSVRLDGHVLDLGNRSGPGLTMQIAPGEVWKGIFALRQSQNNFSPAVKFGAMVRSSTHQNIASGRHSIAVRCNGVWSDDFSFYWEEQRGKD
jgi:hypothetical protein